MNKFFIVSIFLIIHFVSWAQEVNIPVGELSLEEVELALKECDLTLKKCEEIKCEKAEKRLRIESKRILQCNKVKIASLKKKIEQIGINENEKLKVRNMIRVREEQNETIWALFPDLKTILDEASR